MSTTNEVAILLLRVPARFMSAVNWWETSSHPARDKTVTFWDSLPLPDIASC